MVFVPKLDWADSPSTATPITASELVRMEQGIVEGARAASEVQTGNVELASAAEMTAGSDLTRPPSVKRVADYIAAAISTAVGSLPSATAATESAAGIVELATAAEMTAGTDLTRAPSVKRVVDYVTSVVNASAGLVPPVTVTATSAAMIPFAVKAAASQTADVFRALDSSSNIMAAIEKNGEIRAGSSASMVAMFKALCRGAAVPGLILRGAVGQSANIVEIQDSTGSLIMAVSALGKVNGSNVGTIPGTTVAFAPLLVLDYSASVPPGTPAGSVIMRRPSP